MYRQVCQASSDAHILGPAQDRLAIDPTSRLTSYAHYYQARSLPLVLHKAAHLAAQLRLHLRAHGSSIQNLCCHAGSPTRVITRWLLTFMPASRLPSRKLNTSTSSASFIAPLAIRHEPFVHKALACQMITSIGSKEIHPHPLQFFLPIRLQGLACFIGFPGVTLFLQHLFVAMAAGKLFCNLADVLAEAGCILLKGIIK